MEEKKKEEIEKELTEEQMEEVSGGTDNGGQTPTRPTHEDGRPAHYAGIWSARRVKGSS